MLPSIRSLQSCNNSRTALRFPSGCLSSCCGAIATPRLLFSPRRYSTTAINRVAAGEKLEEGPPAARVNDLGVQQLSARLHPQIFKKVSEPPPPELVELARDHLSRHDLYGKTSDTTLPIDFDLPELQGDTLDEHFTKLGMEMSEPYLSMAREFSLKGIPDPPTEWKRAHGWTRYSVDDYGMLDICSVPAPAEDAVVFDVEVLYKVAPYAVMACAASEKAWYAWLSPWLPLEDNSNSRGDSSNLSGDNSNSSGDNSSLRSRHLIPFGDMNKERVIVGHNVGYDRARVREEYDLAQSKNCFLDTMSLHVAVNGMCSRQRPTWLKHKKNRELREKVEKEDHGDDLRAMLSAGLHEDEAEELWVGRSAINSLRDVAKFHCGIELDKEVRDQFGGESLDDVSANLNELLSYCAQDVVATHKVYRIVLPEFLRVCSHPVSFAALRHLSSVILPVNRSWERYIENTEKTYQKISEGVKKRLVELAESALELKDNPEACENDEWLRQLDWSGQEIKYLKLKKGDSELKPAKQKMPGMPKWYKDLFVKGDSPINLSVRSRISPILLRLQWDKHPLIWTGKFGWTFRVPRGEVGKYSSSPLVQCDLSDEKNEVIRNDIENVYYKLPHKNGPGSRCATPLAKGYLQYFESQTLSSEYPLAREALEMNAACSYWISARERIRSQMVVYASDLEQAEGTKGVDKEKEGSDEVGIILPQLIPMGTITRRAVERTWLTASNAKKNRVGSELKAKVIAPPGYAFVGADVDSQELWIASLLGDAQFKIHGGNALGFMTLEGTKAKGTDLHSKTAQILGISRDNAKVFNYGRIYGAGLKFAATLLRAFNPAVTDDQCTKIAADLYSKTKGQQTIRKSLSARRFWRGGTESFVFNTLENFADQERPQTPVLGAGITEALMRQNLSKNGFLPSRINWAIQSSGVDYLHLLVVAMDYLIRTFCLKARLAITVHDEIRYLVKDEHKYKAAMALQVANLWTRAMFSEQIGINDLPQSCAFFSAVDIDHVFRKEVDMDCITPTNPIGISPGESLDILQLLRKEDSLLDTDTAKKIDFGGFNYTPRVPVMEGLQAGTNVNFMKAQISSLPEELDVIAAMAKKAQIPNEDRELDGTGAIARKAQIPGEGRKLDGIGAMARKAQIPSEDRKFDGIGTMARKPITNERFTIIPGNAPPLRPWTTRGTAAEKTTGPQKHPPAGTQVAKDSPVVSTGRPGYVPPPRLWTARGTAAEKTTGPRKHPPAGTQVAKDSPVVSASKPGTTTNSGSRPLAPRLADRVVGRRVGGDWPGQPGAR